MARSARRVPRWQQLQRSHWRTAIPDNPPAQAGHCRCGWFAQKRDVLLSSKTSTIPCVSLLEPGSMNGHMMPLSKTLLPYFKAIILSWFLQWNPGNCMTPSGFHVWLCILTISCCSSSANGKFPLALVRQECPTAPSALGRGAWDSCYSQGEGEQPPLCEGSSLAATPAQNLALWGDA